MKRTHIAVVAVIAIVVIVAAGTALILMKGGEGPTKGTFSYGYMSYSSYDGLMVSDDGSSFDLNDIGDDSALITLWDSSGEPIHYDTSIGYSWIEFSIDLYSDPGITVNSNSIHLQEEYYVDDYYVTFQIEYDGKLYHHEDSDLSITIGDNGHGHMDLVILVSDFNPCYPTIDTPGIEWSIIEK